MREEQSASVGRVVKVSGPLVVAAGMSGSKMYDVVRVGTVRLLGEVIDLTGDRASVQVYEETGGIGPGDPVYPTFEPLSVELGPGLISSIYDGIQRPLDVLRLKSGDFLSRGVEAPALDRKRKWSFQALRHKGDKVGPGDILGTVQETVLVEHRIMVPPEVSGEIVDIRTGEFTVEETICILRGKGGEEIRLTMVQRWPVRRPRPVKARLQPDAPLVTGQRVIDTFFPLAKGGTACVPGPFGSGKTVIQHQFAKWSDAEIIVFVGCGERGNEMTDVLMEFPELKDPKSGEPLMKRTVLVANTSNMPVAAREASVYTGITIGEYFRDMGYSVALQADSTSRWAEAMREISGRLEEMPGEEGYPAYLASRIAEFYERAGRVVCLGSDGLDKSAKPGALRGESGAPPLNPDSGSVSVQVGPSGVAPDSGRPTSGGAGREGALSVVGSVSPPGGDLNDPVVQATLRVVKVFWSLEDKLAFRRHFPAISWLNSYSLYAESLAPAFAKMASEEFTADAQQAMALLSKEAELEEIVRLVGKDALSAADRLVMETARSLREDFLHQNAFHETDTYTSLPKQARMLTVILEFYRLAQTALARGVDIATIERLPVRDRIARMKFLSEHEAETAIAAVREQLVRELAGQVSPETGAQEAAAREPTAGNTEK